MIHQRGCTIGAGGAITLLSNPADEFEEMLVKAKPALRALALQSPDGQVKLCISSKNISYEMPTPTSARKNDGVVNSDASNSKQPDLIETMAVAAQDGTVVLFDYHFDRLEASCAALGYPCPSKRRFQDVVSHSVQRFAASQDPVQEILMARSTLSPCGKLDVVAKLLDPPQRAVTFHIDFPSSLSLSSGSAKPVLLALDYESSTVTSIHKTSERDVYNSARERLAWHCQGSDADVLMFNAAGFLTETTIYNIAIQASANSKWVTPSLADGLLDGTARRYMIDHDYLTEGHLSNKNLPTALASAPSGQDEEVAWSSYPRMVVFNSVRGVRPALLLSNQQA